MGNARGLLIRIPTAEKYGVLTFFLIILVSKDHLLFILEILHLDLQFLDEKLHHLVTRAFYCQRRLVISNILPHVYHYHVSVVRGEVTERRDLR